MKDAHNTVRKSASSVEMFYDEGGLEERIQELAHRDSKLRNDALKSQGLNCRICGFNFEDFYGALGKGFLEVHHLIPVSAHKKYN